MTIEDVIIHVIKHDGHDMLFRIVVDGEAVGLVRRTPVLGKRGAHHGYTYTAVNADLKLVQVCGSIEAAAEAIVSKNVRLTSP